MGITLERNAKARVEVVSVLTGLIVFLNFGLATPSFAQTTVIETQEFHAPSPPPGPLQDLKFVVYKKKFVLPGDPAILANWMTDTRFAMTVGVPTDIPSYAVVQYIRGCLFSSAYANGTVTKTLDVDRVYFGKTIPFQHPTWQIDSDTTDPIYTSDSGHGRFALWRWNQDPSSLDAETSTWYETAIPPHGSVFATDLPGPAFLNPDRTSAQNASLELKTCLFHFADVPMVTTPAGSGLDLKKAIWCVSWDHKFVWDFAHNQISRPTTIDPICAVAPDVSNP